ncbi:MAG TPA: cysteine desulfurase [Candidatus Copromorpha excrementigallinarum]|uniref:Cysteine desulfurase n=1 Tax=Candidatus Allocopromorpha excrementigallinarum TaxID=2840742 RepID=A0A9D1L5P3_9FIRM|nr:cysteine desulfurase [Candidatus Copromorpha excrementigallinarum]
MGEKMIYLDNSATTKQYREVTEIMVRYMEEDFGNPSSLYQLGVDSERAVRKARKQVKEAMNAGEGDIYFTSGGTEADNMALMGAARALKRQGNRIVISSVEHPAVLQCCRRLEREGFDVVCLNVDEKCGIRPEQIEEAVNADTIIVSIMHVNNETGTVMPVKYVKEIMKRKNSPGVFHCDAVQSFGKLELPGEADLISVSGHKIHGPKGSGALFVRKGIHVEPLLEGGGQEQGMRSGTENVPAIAGFGLAAEMTAAAKEEEMKRLSSLRKSLLEGLRDALDGVLINSPEMPGEEAGDCCPSLLNISFENTRGEVILHTLEQEGTYVSTGSACSSNKKGRSHVLKAMGLKEKRIEGAIRFSFGRFNTGEEMGEVVEKTAAAVRRFRRLGSFR